MTKASKEPEAAPQRNNPASTKLEFVRTVDITAEPDDVFGYVADFNRAHEWRTEVVESTMSPPGPMRTGTRLREVALVAGRRVITDSVVDVFEPPHRFTFAHVRGPLPVSGEYRVRPGVSKTGSAGTTLSYTLHVQLVGGWRLLAPLFKITGPRMVDKSLRALATLFDRTSGSDQRRGRPGTT